MKRLLWPLWLTVFGCFTAVFMVISHERVWTYVGVLWVVIAVCGGWSDYFLRRINDLLSEHVAGLDRRLEARRSGDQPG